MAVLVVCFAGSVSIAFFMQGEDEAAELSVLQENLVDFFVPTITYDGETYTVEHRVIQSAANEIVATSTAREVLLLAQYTTAHRLDPVLALEGTNPVALEEAVYALDQSVAEIAQIYGEKERELIREALYPVDFFADLAELEQLRQTLLQHPSEQSAQQYHALLLKTLQSYTDAVDAYQKGIAYAKEKANDPVFHTLDGSVTFSSLEDTLRWARIFVAEQKTKEEQRFRCFRGDISVCESIPVLFEKFTQVPEGSVAIHNTSLPMPLEEMFPDIRRINPHTGNRAPLIDRAQSACLSKEISVRYMPVWREVAEGIWAFAILYADDLFLFDVSDPRLTDAFHREVHDRGITYKPQQPFNFYICRTAFEETALVRTLLAVRALDAELPVGVWAHNRQLAELRNEIQTADVLSEATVRNYLSLLAEMLRERGEIGFANEYGLHTRVQVEKMLHVFHQQTPHADELVRKIMYDNSYVSARQRVNATPLGFANLFVSRGIMPPFFAFNTTMAPADISPLELSQESNLESFLLTSYRLSLADTYTRAELVALMLENTKKYRVFVEGEE